MNPIPLGRHFVKCESAEDHLISGRYSGLVDAVGWDELLKNRRVVVLAEAGSGKSTELREQARARLASGQYAFYATVEDVGRHGLDDSLRAGEARALDAWRAGSEHAWFFIDSVDEARLHRLKLQTALRRLARAVDGHEGRAFVVLSSRYTDWDFASDLQTFRNELPLPAPEVVVPDLRTLILNVLGQKKRPEPPPVEVPVVVVMGPLDDSQVRAYAHAKRVEDVDALMDALAAANFEEFARRPLDLDWIIDYWRDQHELGSYSQMIEVSLRARLAEPDQDRARHDLLDPLVARQGIERVGAALVLSRCETVAIPTSEAGTAPDGVRLDEVLDDWTPASRHALLLRPVFDPATYARARLHSDNEGTVRAYLAAKWLARLRGSNLSIRGLHDLLFATSYEIALVKPSMRATAAWLSLLDAGVANEVLRREPLILCTEGDPASLQAPIRIAVLDTVVDLVRAGEELPLLDERGLARFASPDLAVRLRGIWADTSTNLDVREFVLRLIWLGSISDCVDIALDATHDADRHVATLAGRAVLAAGDEGVLSSYAQRVVEDRQSLPARMLWDAVEKLFPRHLDVAAFLTIVGSVSVDGLERGGFSLDWGGPSLISAVTSGDDLVRLISGLLGQLPLEERGAARGRNRGRAELYASTLTTATKRLLEVCPPDSIPTVAIDALMMVRGLDTYSTDARRSSIDRATELASCSSERRERLFWRAAELVQSNQAFDSAPLNAPWQMRMLGWPASLRVEDVAWLITDGLTRAAADDRHLALNATLELWEQAGRPDDLSTKIDNAIRTDAELVTAYSRWIDPPAKPENQVRLEARLAAQREAAAADEEAAVQGWLKFIAKIQEAPDHLEHLDLFQATGVDTRHYNLWRLLYQATSRNSRYSVTTAAPLLEIVGPAVMKALEIGLSQIWRARKPNLERERAPNARNQVDLFDAMGLAAISLECLSSADAMADLTSADAIRAAEYATLELNGFPSLLPVLAKTHPTEVQQVLMDAINAELHQPSAAYPYQILGDALRADDAIVRLLEAPLWTELSRNPSLDTRALEPILRILSRARDIQVRSDLNELAVAQLRTASDVAICSLYFGAACAVDATSATDALLSKIESLPSVSERTLLAQHALPQAFGSSRTEPPRESRRLFGVSHAVAGDSAI